MASSFIRLDYTVEAEENKKIVRSSSSAFFDLPIDPGAKVRRSGAKGASQLEGRKVTPRMSATDDTTIQTKELGNLAGAVEHFFHFEFPIRA